MVKISDAIKKLQAIKEEHGNLPLVELVDGEPSDIAIGEIYLQGACVVIASSYTNSLYES